MSWQNGFRITSNNIVMKPSLHVSLGERTYPIYIGAGLLKNTGIVFKKHRLASPVVIITDTHITALYRSMVERSLQKEGFTVRTIVVPSGEQQKSLRRSETIYTQLLKWNIDRSATIAALGGGVIGDLAGFIAATYQRGINFVQLPTSLLAQVDSSVGGKVGINHPRAKNMIGAFYQPKFVLADIATLKTLPQREIVCGLGEVIKYGIILDRTFFDFTKKHFAHALNGDANVLQRIVKRSCELKAEVVSRDERESNLRAILNFGHTVGHALEHAGSYIRLKHGEAIAYGMVAETYIARAMSLISAKEQRLIEELISALPLPKLSTLRFSASSLTETMKVDKKSSGGVIRMVLPRRIGEVTLPLPVPHTIIRNSIEYLKEYAS